PSGVSPHLGEDAEGRLSDWQLVELGVHAPEVVGAPRIARLDLRTAHREGVPPRPHRAEAVAPTPLGGAQEIEVDLHLVHLLHTADVRVPELLVRVHERTRAFEAGGRVDHLVAVDAAAAALDLVLRTERKRLFRDRLVSVHAGIVGVPDRAAQDLTSRTFSGICGGLRSSRGRYTSPSSRRATFSTSCIVNALKSGSRPSGCSSARNQSAWTVAIPISPAPRTSS